MIPRKKSRLNGPPHALHSPGRTLPGLPADEHVLPTVQRKSSRERGYSSKWDTASKTFIRRNPLCLGCKAVGRAEPATLTDHVIPHRGDMKLFWRSDLWQPLCRPHHDIVKADLERRFDRGELQAEDLRLDSPAAISATHRML